MYYQNEGSSRFAATRKIAFLTGALAQVQQFGMIRRAAIVDGCMWPKFRKNCAQPAPIPVSFAARAQVLWNGKQGVRVGGIEGMR